MFKTDEEQLAPQKPFNMQPVIASTPASRLPALAAQVVPMLQNGPSREPAPTIAKSDTFLTGVDIDDSAKPVPAAAASDAELTVHQSTRARAAAFCSLLERSFILPFVVVVQLHLTQQCCDQCRS